MGNARRARLLGILALVVLTACGETGATPAATADREGAISSLGQRELDRLLAGGGAPPAPVGWDLVRQSLGLDPVLEHAFCTSLDQPGVDNGLASLIALGVNYVSMRFRRKPAPEDLEEVLGLATTFAAKTCPLWLPGKPVVTPKPEFPDGFTVHAWNPDLAWRFLAPETVTCAAPCWEVEALTRGECTGTSLVATVTSYDDAWVAMEEITDSTILVFAGVPGRLSFEATDARTTRGRLTYLACAG